jgi:hypothetical protein
LADRVPGLDIHLERFRGTTQGQHYAAQEVDNLPIESPHIRAAVQGPMAGA